MRLAAAAIVFLFLSSPAQAFTCDQVRAYVAQHGMASALSYAIKNGATWRQIRQARRCLRKETR